jgi:cation diffusion facilitator family transporter
MSHFPGPVHVPEQVFEERDKRERQIMTSAKRGALIRVGIILFELFGVVLYGSSALLMDALASFLDVASTLFLILSVKLAGKPPDKDHPFGHGRLEPLVGLQLGFVLALVGFGMLVLQFFQMGAEPTQHTLDKRTWIFPLIALILLEVSYRSVMWTAKSQNSPALAADAIHYRIDGIASLLALISLILAAYFPSWSLTLDHAGAMMISLLMIILGSYAAYNNLHQLMDRIPNQTFFERVRKASLKVPGVKDTEKIRIQQYGPDAHVDIDIEVDPQLSVEKAHEISQGVRVEIRKEWPAVLDVTVHIEPYYPNDHKGINT